MLAFAICKEGVLDPFFFNRMIPKIFLMYKKEANSHPEGVSPSKADVYAAVWRHHQKHEKVSPG
jgi:hypothetical protein